jgi:hypothetical protein
MADISKSPVNPTTLFLLLPNIQHRNACVDRLCGLEVKVFGYVFRGLECDSRCYQIAGEVVSPERGPFSLVRINELLFISILGNPELYFN